MKAELKRRCLPVSGSKPQLIERLKPFTETTETNEFNLSDHHDAQRNCTGKSSLVSSDADDLCSNSGTIKEKNEDGNISCISLPISKITDDSLSSSGKISIIEPLLLK